MKSILTTCSLILFLAGHSAIAEELLRNGDFDDKLEHWQFVFAKEYADKIDEPTWQRKRQGSPASVAIVIPYPSKAHYLRLQQETELESQKVYRLRYEARGAVEGKGVRVVCAQSQKNKLVPVGLSQSVPVNKSWTQAELVFRTTELATATPARIHLNLGDLEGRVEFRNVSLTGPFDDLAEPHRHGTLIEKAAAPPAPALRTWTDTRGRERRGTLKRVANDVAEIETPEGAVLKVPLSKLAAADRDYLKPYQAKPTAGSSQ